MNIVALKILVGVSFGVVRFFSGLLPYQIYKCLGILDDPPKKRNINRKKREDFVEGAFLPLQSFSAGALFATCILHMIPNVNQAVVEMKSLENLESEYPLSQLIVSSGFFIVYFAEELCEYILSIIPENGDDDSILSAGERSKPSRRNHQPTPMKNKLNIDLKRNSGDKKLNKKDTNLPQMQNGNLPNITSNQIVPVTNNSVMVKNGTKTKNSISYEINFLEADMRNILPYVLNVNKDPKSGNTINLYRSRNKGKEWSERQKGGGRNQKITEIEEERDFDKLIQSPPRSRQQILRYIVVILALSSHAIFEGIAIGLQRSVANTWYLLVALSIHSATNLFSSGLDLVKEKTKFRTIIIHVFVVSIASPLGVFIGLGISLTTDHTTKAESVALVVLEGLSAGTILYITFFEVLKKEKELRKHTFKRAECILLGFGLLAFLEYAEVSK